MITCKEDLMNTYIENDQGELREVYLSLIEELEVPVSIDGEYRGTFIAVLPSCNVVQSISTSIHTLSWCKKLTMSDLKPKLRTKTVYGKADFSNVGECVQSVHDNYGEYFFLNKSTGEYQLAEYQDSAWYWKEDNIYIKVEKEIDWREELNEWQHTAKIGIYSPLDFEVSSLIETDPDKFLELCRVALRATGELE